MRNKLLKPNSYYEGLLQNLYSGDDGSFVMFMQFFYQYNQALIFFKENESIFFDLWNKEIENCKMLSELLLRIGGDNCYYSSSRRFLSGCKVDYSKSLGNIFLNDIESLEISIIEIKNSISKIDDNEIKNVLKLVLNNKRNMLKNLKENYFKNNLLLKNNNRLIKN